MRVTVRMLILQKSFSVACRTFSRKVWSTISNTPVSTIIISAWFRITITFEIAPCSHTSGTWFFSHTEWMTFPVTRTAHNNFSSVIICIHLKDRISIMSFKWIANSNTLIFNFFTYYIISVK